MFIYFDGEYLYLIFPSIPERSIISELVVNSLINISSVVVLQLDLL